VTGFRLQGLVGSLVESDEVEQLLVEAQAGLEEPSFDAEGRMESTVIRIAHGEPQEMETFSGQDESPVDKQTIMNLLQQARGLEEEERAWREVHGGDSDADLGESG
jgi:hypothetical protein